MCHAQTPQTRWNQCEVGFSFRILSTVFSMLAHVSTPGVEPIVEHMFFIFNSFIRSVSS